MGDAAPMKTSSFESRLTIAYSRFQIRALSLIAIAAVVHWMTTMILLLAIPGHDDADIVSPVGIIVLATALSAVGGLYLRCQYSTPGLAATTVGRLYFGVPFIAIPLALPATLPTDIDLDTWLAVAIPIAGCAWASGLLIGLGVDFVLHRLAKSTRASDTERGQAPRSLVVAFGRVSLVTTAAAVLVALSTEPRRLIHAPPDQLLAVMLTTIALLGLAWIAGMWVGRNPADDLTHIVHQLDRLGLEPNRTELEHPVTMTSGDEIGELLLRLEELRVHLIGDVEAYRRALDKAKAADALKSEFLNVVSHELRTPLNAIGGFAQLLLEDAPPRLTETQAEDVRLIQTGGRQLLGLINDILDMSMIESGELRLSYTPTDIAQVVEEVVDIHRPLVRDGPVMLKTNIEADLPAIECDARRVGQVLTNLISNAVKFTDHGSITVAIQHDHDREELVISCIDTGVGIAESDVEHIFEEYRQAGSPAQHLKGTGLGLAIARRIAEAHGGTLTARSKEGEGSTFQLRLPIDPPQRLSTIDMAGEAAQSRARMRVRTRRSTNVQTGSFNSVPAYDSIDELS